ncbi:MAG: hypothetical protein RLY97_977 [Pseudomonadota bacterium]
MVFGKGVHAETRRKKEARRGAWLNKIQQIIVFSMRDMTFSTYHDTSASRFFSAPLRETILPFLSAICYSPALKGQAGWGSQS